MRYTEPRERSAELLRAALAKMALHDAALNPITFAVWYEVMSGSNVALERALANALKTEARLGDATILRLYAAHVSAVDSEQMTRLSADFQRVMASVSESATRTGQTAGVVGRQLDGLSSALRHDGALALAPVLSETLHSLADMKQSTETLARQVAASRQEIDRLRDDLSRAREQALLDPLTGILNRGGFDRRLDALLAAAGDGQSHCLVMFDIDHFKKVNDTHGHVVGDRVIAAVGEVLRKSLTDGAHAAARYGGEEFAVLMPRSSVDQAARLAETVRARTRAMKLRKRDTQELLMTVTLSAGVAATAPGDDAQRLIARADAALYRSKQAGRDRVSLSAP